MANKIALIEKYTRDAVVQILAAESKSRVLEADAKRINLDFAGGNIVKVLNLEFDGLSDYKRAANSDITAAAGYTEFNAGDSTGRGYLASDVGAEWETFQLAYHRAAQLKIDRADDEENAGLVVGYAVSEFVRTKVISEIDATRFSKLAGSQIPYSAIESKPLFQRMKLSVSLTLLLNGLPKQNQLLKIKYSL